MVDTKPYVTLFPTNDDYDWLSSSYGRTTKMNAIDTRMVQKFAGTGGKKASKLKRTSAVNSTVTDETDTSTIGATGIRMDARKVTITPPKFETAQITIIGTVPLVMHKFSQKVQNSIRETQEAGSVARKGKARAARDFEEQYENAKHVSTDGWCGIPASAFRNALISACRMVGFKMTIAKMSVFVVADGYDEQGTGLVKITVGQPHQDVRPGRNANGGIDLRSRPMWDAGWEATVTFRWDADQFTASDLINLLARAGQQVGICEGRPDSKMSAGCGWGEFAIKG